MEALKGISSFIKTRKNEFESVDDAIKWSVKSGTIRNLGSARVSIPPLLKKRGSSHVWKTDLMASQHYWEGWFIGLSEKFLSASAAKLLILAGRYQLLVFPEVGHMVQEDAPERTASALVEFWKRNEKLVLPVKKPFVGNKG
ncbi:3341_t:CDS:2 [Acaulospora colombiana]|uniref:3341_t:CDS:1 n=1 Tax=Acaulospora colombiana TaxID=27376 RepID=A0ACA9LBN6_9GLOM|nr:3341_t:CDS:2 [Acaulospora colombiana]